MIPSYQTLSISVNSDAYTTMFSDAFIELLGRYWGRFDRPNPRITIMTSYCCHFLEVFKNSDDTYQTEFMDLIDPIDERPYKNESNIRVFRENPPFPNEYALFMRDDSTHNVADPNKMDMCYASLNINDSAFVAIFSDEFASFFKEFMKRNNIPEVKNIEIAHSGNNVFVITIPNNQSVEMISVYKTDIMPHHLHIWKKSK